MESKTFISEEEKKRLKQAELEKKAAIQDKVNTFMGEKSQKYENEKNIVVARTKWAQLFGMEKTPKKVAEKSVEMAYDKVYKAKSLSKSQLAKRTAAFNEKESRQNTVNAEMYQYHTIRDRAVNLLAEDSDDGEAGFLESRDVEKSKYAEATQDIAVFAYLSQQDSMRDMAKKFYKSASSTDTEDSAPLFLLKEMEKLDLSEFEYGSDNEFATGLSTKIAKLRAFAHAEEYLREIKLGRLNVEGTTLDITALTAKAQMLDAIKTDYENRMLLMRSPYYVFMAKKDMDGLSEKELKDMVTDVKNEELKAYVAAFKNLKKNKLFEKGCKVSGKEKKIKGYLEKLGGKTDGETDLMIDKLKEYAKDMGFKYEEGSKRSGILAMYYYDKYGEDAATDVNVFIENNTPLLNDKKLSSSQKKKIKQMLDDYAETATMLQYIKTQNASEQQNEKGGAQPAIPMYRDQGFISLALESPAFKVLAEKLQSERDRRAVNRYDSYNQRVLTNVITAPDKSGLLKDRLDSKNSITRQKVYDNKIELIRYKKEKKVFLSEDEKKLLGGTEEINEESIAQRKKELADIASAKLRVVSDEFLDGEKAFIDVERDWMSATSHTMWDNRNQDDGFFRKDITGIDRLKNHDKYKKGGSGMIDAAETDVENLVYSLLMDKQLSIPELQAEEPLLTALKGYMMFMMVGENAIMKKTVDRDIAREKVKIQGDIVSAKDAQMKIVKEAAKEAAKKAAKGAVTEVPTEVPTEVQKEDSKKDKKKDLKEVVKDPDREELTSLKQQLDKLEKEVVRVDAFALRLRTSIPISLTYLPNSLKLRSYADARQIIMQEEDGKYKQQLLKTLDEKEAELKKEVETNKISAYETMSNGVLVKLTENQIDVIKKLSVVFDKFTELRERKAEVDDEGEDAETIREEAQLQLEEAMKILVDYTNMDKA